MAFVDLTGETFDRVKVLRRAETTQPNTNGIRWVCQCACGSPTFTVTGKDLRRGRTRSCGCLRIEVAIAQLAKLRQPAILTCQWCHSMQEPEELMPVLFAIEPGGSGMQCRNDRACNKRRKALAGRHG